ncbi:cytochrome c biogenesis protein CcsA [Lutimonas halocynthiae]|uniref:cytochrome c biogenesis protein CcsA n=1 Tax=Lutimonas halocynthiae TaxID=1446477 RepID=UPI0025B4BD8A|nr:cytochrome c biogenesis protein CcsA [Lutimonas halocynthiae]MDN3644069.1 cytochrome c biogenesis protein CcsA [Lutimonas halocynthiae]
MKSILSILFSPKMALTLLFVFAASMATATFVENDFGTQTARTVIYNAWWFELVMVLLGMNFIANMFRYKLFRRQKWPVLLFHIAFIVILVGAGISRYTGFEGIMRIREGASSNIMISDKNYLQLHLVGQEANPILQKEIYFSPIKDNNIKIESSIDGEAVFVSFKEFIPDAREQLIKATNEKGDEFIELVLAAGNGRETIYIQEESSKLIGTHQHEIAFQSKVASGVEIFKKNDSLKIRSTEDIDFFTMATEAAGMLDANVSYNLRMNTLYRFHDFSFVAVKHEKNGKLVWKSASKKPKDNDDNIDDLLVFDIESKGEQQELAVVYKHGHLPKFKSFYVHDKEIKLGYGALAVKTDFSLKLRDFQMEKYPGSTSPSSYASEVTIIDGAVKEDFRIYMNHVLDYKGHRFFQASYDSDEKGTVLAINKDLPGTVITYIGYILMGLGMFLTLFVKGSRFNLVRKRLDNLKSKTLSLLVIGFLFSLSSQAQSIESEQPIDSVLISQRVDKMHAALFGKLMVQDLDGRIKPLNTLASEFLRKVSRKNYYKGNNVKLDANQVFLAIHLDPGKWYSIPLIKIDKKKGGEVFASILTNNDGLVPFNGLLDLDKDYILEDFVLKANEKKPGERSEFDKEILKVDERFNLLFNVLSGNYLKIFPKKDDPLKTWYNPNYSFEDFNEADARFAKGIIPLYFVNIQEAKTTGDWSEAEDSIAYIKKYQDVLAADIIPSEERISAELWYNQLNLNFWLFQAYFTIGMLLLVLAIIRIFIDRPILRFLMNLLVVISLIVFLIHSFNLILRWYIAGHPPWSNGYEMIVFVAWSLMFFGLAFFRKSDFSLPLASIFTGTLLFVSYLDWLSPEITNLMPVLKSYWLKIHVATIISSYAPLALSALLGIMAQLLIIFRNSSNAKVLNLKIKELSYINEMSMTLGLFILSIGTFLGGVWANESWGRYWAWDPKETWALISIIVYAIVLHMRLIPKLNNDLVISVASTFAFLSIAMTSFGVNYYLTGLHSYATGDPVPIPNFVYISVFVLLIISLLSIFKQNWQKARKN